MTTADQTSAPTDAEIASACRWLDEHAKRRVEKRGEVLIGADGSVSNVPGAFTTRRHTLAKCIIATARALGWHPPQSAPVAERVYARAEVLKAMERAWRDGRTFACFGEGCCDGDETCQAAALLDLDSTEMP